MANRSLFATRSIVPRTDARNHSHAPAYALDDKAALAQLALTGCLNSTFYASATDQLDTVLALCVRLPATYIGQTAVLARQSGHMKDLPALLCAVLAARPTEHDRAVLDLVFDRVIDTGRMLRNFVQILRSGVTGRRSLGSRPKRLVRRWLDARSDLQVFADSVGNAPSLADVIRMVHPRPRTESRRALYGYLLGRPYDVAALPQLAQDYESYKWVARYGKADGWPVPPVPFSMLTGLTLGTAQWTAIARTASWQMTRMNLRTFARHGVFDDDAMVDLVAQRLADPALIARARVFPYQLLQAARMAADLPQSIQQALEAALETAVENVPFFAGLRVAICPDVSGSMASPVTGYRAGATTAVRCIDVAGLLAAAFLRRSEDALVLPFEHRVVACELSRHRSVLANAQALAAIGGGGTSCSAPLKRLAAHNERVDLVILVSDNESWCHVTSKWRPHGTATMQAFRRVQKRNPGCKLVCIDIQPHTTSQASSLGGDVLNVGGFSDAVFGVIAAFAAGEHRGDHLVSRIEAVAVG